MLPTLRPHSLTSLWSKKVKLPARAPTDLLVIQKRHVTNMGPQLTSLWSKNVMLPTWGPNWPFRCLYCKNTNSILHIVWIRILHWSSQTAETFRIISSLIWSIFSCSWQTTDDFFIQMILLHISIAWYFSIINLGHPWTADIFPYSVTWFILIVSQLILLHISLLSNPRSVDTSPCFCQSSQSAFSCIQARSRKRILSTKCAHFITYNNYRVAEVARMRGQRLPISVDSDKT